MCEDAKPMGKAFSFIQTSSNSMAHIDRIYVHKNLLTRSMIMK